MQVSVLIPVHNRIDVTMECLRCLDVQTYRDLRIIVVDDGSSDQSNQKIRLIYPRIEVLQGDGNLWWAGAMHLGVEHILSSANENDFILSLNNDTAFSPDFIESLVDMSLTHGRAIVGSMEIDYHQRDAILERGVWIDWAKFQLDVKTGPPEDDKATCNEQINVLPGRGTLIPIEVFKKIGNYDKETFPHYIADYDFTVRAYNAGIKLVLSYRSKICTRTDLTGISIAGRPLTMKEAYSNFFSIRSDNNLVDLIQFVRKHSPKKYRERHIAGILMNAFSRLRIVRLFTVPVVALVHGLRIRRK